MKDWHPPKHWDKITTIDTHTEGEPFRVITSGFPNLKGNTILEKKRYVKTHFDHLRTTLMWEPRGHADMYGCIVTPPVSEDADFGVLFLHNERFSSNVCIFAEGEVDRSPTGTGVSARMALHFAKGEIGMDQPLVIESIIGTTFSGRVLKQVSYGPHQAIIPEVEGTSYITGKHEFLIDPLDPLKHGFILR